MKTKKVLQQILHFPLVKIIIGFSVLGIVMNISQNFTHQILNLFEINKDVQKLIEGIVSGLIAITTYVFLFKYYEKRKITEFSRNKMFTHLLIGFVLGVVLQSLTILVIYLKGGYTIISVNPIWYILPPLTMAITSAIFEEIMIRGILFRIMEEKLGSYIALFITAILFGAMHLGNENSSLIASIGLAIQAGLLLGAAFIYARNLWLPIAIHFAWNFAQTAIYGANVSGIKMSKILIKSEITGDIWFTGGGFGPEGSIQATLFCLTATIVLLILSHKKGNIIKPFWIK